MSQTNHLSIFTFNIQNKGEGALDVHIDGDIVDATSQQMMKDFWGDETSVSYKSFRNQIEAVNPKTINLYINSTGGHVGDAMAMHDYLSELESKGTIVNRRGRGIIASAATYLLMGNNSEMSQNSFMMIHNVQMMAVGDINYVENQVKTGRKFNDKIRDYYANETLNPPETIASWMNKETWMNAQDAKDRGFIKAITGEAKFSNQISHENFPYSNTSILNTYNNQIQMDNKLLDAINNGFASLLEKLGLKDKAAEQNIVDAQKEFCDAIVNAVPNEEKINLLISEAIKNQDLSAFAKASDLEGLAKVADLTNLVKKEELTASLTSYKNEITTAVSDKLGNNQTRVPQPEVRRIKNKFSNASGWEVN